jgi:hypothetical protein
MVRPPQRRTRDEDRSALRGAPDESPTPFFADKPLDAITVEDVDRYWAVKVRERDNPRVNDGERRDDHHAARRRRRVIASVSSCQ